MDLFHILGRYFLLLYLAIGGYRYFVGLRSLASKDPADPRTSAEAIAYFRPQDRNAFVLAWFVSVFLLAFYFAFWAFFRGGAEKVVLLQPFELNWYRTSLRGTTRGTIALTEGSRDAFPGNWAPLGCSMDILLVSLGNFPLPR
jgi:hypothetical protein